MANYDEKQLVVEYSDRKKRVKEAETLLSERKAKLEDTAKKIIEHLEDSGATSTSKYEGLGRITLNAPKLHAGFDENYRSEVFDFLRQNGMEDAIKETVHHSTLSSFIASLIKEGVPIPEYITTYYRKQVSFDKA